ncbi:MAG: hypothetical protein A2908_02235 [Candidatus Staskawiczbacteria bacterium RIFCSPLOWO2_01_FULL_38_12b]|uniref:Blue (type 1) copper domain-containing protein n=1 Tax=Candidatus Staskawiczbacteria bacterium RIFCSPLOWO2_01_FULL_38_12b TaxID=1802214 RepID=A0A1G2IDY9_9BACT|nr:MAG: hypothetical protein A2908_02235 [Candidatus Staskawiczbacteria bacterium RIFCSPLOWO2_01_FULL_38_12b]
MKKIIIILVGVAVVATGGYFLIIKMDNDKQQLLGEDQQTNQQPQNQTNNTNISDSLVSDQIQVQTYEVIYTDAGYAPSELKINTGDTVVFKNESSFGMWTASAMHPNHTTYSGTSLQQHCPDLENNDFDQCKNGNPGTSWNFTFSKAGTFGYHNHAKSSHFGKIIVE